MPFYDSLPCISLIVLKAFPCGDIAFFRLSMNSVCIGFIHESSWNEMRIADNARVYKTWQSMCPCNNKFTLPQPLSPHIEKSACFARIFFRMMSAFLKKTRMADLQFFLTFFDKIKSQKRCKGMLNPALKSPVRTLLTYSIPCLGCPDNLF